MFAFLGSLPCAVWTHVCGKCQEVRKKGGAGAEVWGTWERRRAGNRRERYLEPNVSATEKKGNEKDIKHMQRGAGLLRRHLRDINKKKWRSTRETVPYA